MQSASWTRGTALAPAASHASLTSRSVSSSAASRSSSGSSATWETVETNPRHWAGVRCQVQRNVRCSADPVVRSSRSIGSVSSGWASAGSRRIARHCQSCSSTGTFQTQPSQPPGRSTRATSATAAVLGNQCHASATRTASTEASRSGGRQRLPVDPQPRCTAGDEREHPAVGLDDVEVEAATDQPVGELPGAGSDLGDPHRVRRQQPVDGVAR